MASTTENVTLQPNAWTNVSQGDINCAVFAYSGAQVRVYVGDSAPVIDSPHVFVRVPSIAGRVAPTRIAMVEGVVSSTSVWLRSEHEPVEVVVVRGDGRMNVGLSA